MDCPCLCSLHGCFPRGTGIFVSLNLTLGRLAARAGAQIAGPEVTWIQRDPMVARYQLSTCIPPQNRRRNMVEDGRSIQMMG